MIPKPDSVGARQKDRLVRYRTSSSLLAGQMVLEITGTTNAEELDDCLKILDLFRGQLVRLIERYSKEDIEVPGDTN